ncbi:hypothetical protein QTH90_00185 [Variovorax sp. J2P1-59]|uniref:hypothetical protein n=1 Tax=Variovorax flavidus TaxID=3053501 RepID=UPI0025783927|nr:hypothetical protein [Variovorax sp. J2P1-59]MDM0072782.1 hypothetical protein [Variovorax sp. J2P1-59]
MKLASALCAVALALNGCASRIDRVDTSKAEPECVRQCSARYSSCVSSALLTAVLQACFDAYQVCINTCPAK